MIAKTIKGLDGEKRWNPKAECPVHAMTCEQARKTKTCKGGNPDRELTCKAFTCAQCTMVVPYEYGAGDANPSLCDDCAVEARSA